MLMIAARSRQKKTKIDRMTSVRRSYRIGNQMRLPKHRLYIGQAIVGIHVSKSRNDTTAIQMVVFHLPRGANRSDPTDLHAISMPKTKVMYPTRKIAYKLAYISMPAPLCTYLVVLSWIALGIG
jgi:hypothetical protein